MLVDFSCTVQVHTQGINDYAGFHVTMSHIIADHKIHHVIEIYILLRNYIEAYICTCRNTSSVCGTDRHRTLMYCLHNGNEHTHVCVLGT